MQRVCVYCASSTEAHPDHYAAARTLGRFLAEQAITIVYGGGSVGSMGALADAALAAGGRLVGILPKFMNDLEWGHKSLTELRLVDDMHHRKRMMIEESDAVVALPGGSGTFEELLDRAIAERFMDARHRDMWTFVDRPEDVLPAIGSAPDWSAEARAFARPGAGPRG